ncbi:MAG: TonB-dependent receptor [Saprospiraceae bacterium]
MKTIRNIFFITISSIFSFVTLSAQQVTGKVLSENSEPLIGVSISVKGTALGSVTDLDGNYSVDVKGLNDVLIFYYIGYKTQELPVNGQSILNVTMSPDVQQIEQITVIGYGSISNRDVTGSVKTLRKDEFNKGIINSPEQLLQGKVAGVNVTTASGDPNSAISITVRGPGGVRTGSDPLYVIDGFAINGSANFLNPEDIESIDILKDASATAIYGARGANGVILITTKKGKEGKSSLDFSVNYGVSTLARALGVFSPNEFRKQVTAVGGTLQDLGANTDWQKEITRSALTKNYNLNLSGGSNKLLYNASLGLQDQEGIIKTNDNKRYTGRLSVGQKFMQDRLKLDLNLGVTYNTVNRPSIGSLIGDAISNNPTFPALGADGRPVQYTGISNPLTTLELEKSITEGARIIGNVSPSFTILKGLVYKLNFGVDYSNYTTDNQSLPNAVPLRDGRLETFYNIGSNRLIENYLTYEFKIDKHSFNALAGHSYQKFFGQARAYSINKFPINNIEPIYNPGLGQELTLANNRPTGSAGINELQSYFGRLNYQFNDKYLVTATVRADGSSKFGANNKYGVFPSFSVGWRIMQEDFMKGNKLFSNLKLRAGWGRTGNQEIPAKITQAAFTSQVGSNTSYPLFNTGSYPPGTTFSRLANPDIQWEVSGQANVGIDFGIFGGALNGTIDYFNKVSNNILLEVIPSDPVQPAGTFWTNVKDMEIDNQGLEFALNYEKNLGNGWRYNLGGNSSFIKNIVKNSPYSVIPSGSASGSGLTSATINGYINNQPIGTFYLKEFTGIDDKGLSKFRDVDGDGIISDKDRVALGSALPKAIFSFFGGIGLKELDFSVNFNGVSGNKIYDNTANSNFYKVRISKGINVTPDALDYPNESISNAAPVSSRYLKDGSYLRLNNMSLGYTLKPSAIGLGKILTGARVSVTGQNLWLSTKYNGYDPEVNTERNINGVSSYGIDYLSYPKAKTILFGLNLTF